MKRSMILAFIGVLLYPQISSAQFDLGKLKNVLEKTKKAVEEKSQAQAPSALPEQAQPSPSKKSVSPHTSSDGLTSVDIELKGIKPRMAIESYVKVFADIGLKCNQWKIPLADDLYKFGDASISCRFRGNSNQFSVFGIPFIQAKERGYSANFLEGKLTRVQLGNLEERMYSKKDFDAMIAAFSEKYKVAPKIEKQPVESEWREQKAFVVSRIWKNKSDSSMLIVTSLINTPDCSQYIKRDAEACEVESSTAPEEKVSFIIVVGNIEQIMVSQGERAERETKSREATFDSKRKKDF